MIFLRLSLFYLSLVLYLLPPINLRILYSHGVAEILTHFSFILFLTNVKNRKNIYKSDFFLLLIFYFFTQSISIISAMDISSFMKRYRDLIVQFIFFLISIDFFLRYERKFLTNLFHIFLAATILNLICELFIFFNPIFFENIANFLLHPTHAEYISMNIERNRIYFQSYQYETIIPILFYILSVVKNRNYKNFMIFLIFTVSLVSFLSNFRTRFLMTLISFSAIFILRNNFRKIFKTYLLIILSLFIGFNILSHFKSRNVISRFLSIFEFNQVSEDLQSIYSRFNQINEAISIGSSNIFTGVGLGNYLNFVNLSYYKNLSIFYLKYKNIIAQDSMPHNFFLILFSETGFLGLLSGIVIITYFIFYDIKLFFGKNLEEKNKLSKILIISFWILFIYGILNPSYSVSYNIIFWLLRAYLLVKTSSSNAIKIA